MTYAPPGRIDDAYGAALRHPASMPLADYWDWLEAQISRLASIGDADTDDADLLVRKHALAITVAGLIPLSLLWVALGLLLDRLFLATASALFVFFLAVSLWLYRRNKQLDWFVELLLLVGVVYVLSGHIGLGGFVTGGGSLIWGLLAPVGAVLFYDAWYGLKWLTAYAALIVGAMMFDTQIAAMIPAPWAETPIILVAYNVLGPALIVLLMIRYVDGQRLSTQQRLQDLLHDVLPAPIADELARGERLIAEHHESVSVLFADLVNFTPFAERAKPDDVLLTLNDLFSAFDVLTERFGLEKIKTIGDAYMAVAGAPLPREDHAEAAVKLAIAMHREVRRRSRMRSRHLVLRIGIASGPVTAGVIGRHRFAYDLWGDTVNVASRMESSGVPGQIQVSAETHRLVGDAFPFVERGTVVVKGKGEMVTYLLDPDLMTEAAYRRLRDLGSIEHAHVADAPVAVPTAPQLGGLHSSGGEAPQVAAAR